MITLRRGKFYVLLLPACLSVMQVGVVHAAMVGTDEALAAEQHDAARDRVQALVNRADIRQRLQDMGIQASAARARIAALSDAEVASLTATMDKQPAGGDLGQTDLIVILLLAILLVIVI